VNKYTRSSTLCYSVTGSEAYHNLKQITIEESLRVGKKTCCIMRGLLVTVRLLL